MRYPFFYSIETFCQDGWHRRWESELINGKWYPARPVGMPTFSSRLKLAWLVFTGKGDVLFWPEHKTACLACGGDISNRESEKYTDGIEPVYFVSECDSCRRLGIDP